MHSPSFSSSPYFERDGIASFSFVGVDSSSLIFSLGYFKKEKESDWFTLVFEVPDVVLMRLFSLIKFNIYWKLNIQYILIKKEYIQIK